MILALSGKKYSGKTTTCNFIRSKYPNIKEYSFADYLKNEICIKLYNLDPKFCHGTNEEKNQLTHLLWENMPGSSKSGLMTGREVMQYLGTEVFRKIDQNVWVSNCINQIKIDQPEIAIITDLRFPNEVEFVNEHGGKVIRLSRNVFNDDHESETALDNYDKSKYFAYIDNQNLSLEDSLLQVLNFI